MNSCSRVSHPDPLAFGFLAAPGHKPRSRSLGPHSADRRSRRQRREKASTKPLRERSVSTPAWARKEAGNLSALLELHLNLPEAWRRQERGPRAPHLTCRRKRETGFFFFSFFLGSTGHKAVAPAAEDTPFPSPSLSFTCKILIPIVQEEGDCMH